jgi:hypothetical protein
MKLVLIEELQTPIKHGFAKDLFADWLDADWQALDKEFNALFKDA